MGTGLDKEIVGRVLQSLRYEKHVSCHDLGWALGLTPTLVTRIQNGTRAMTLCELLTVCEILEVELLTFLERYVEAVNDAEEVQGEISERGTAALTNTCEDGKYQNAVVRAAHARLLKKGNPTAAEALEHVLTQEGA